MTLPDFLTDTDGYIRLTGHRIGLVDIVYYFNEGYSPEMLMGQYPTLPLALIYKVIAFYLENQDQVDAYVATDQAEVERHAAAAKKGPSLAELRRRMENMRRAGA